MKHNNFFTVICFANFLTCYSIGLVFGHHQAAERHEELDVWQGSSLGIRLDFEDSIPIVSDIYPHVVNSSPFQKQDAIVELGLLKFPGATMAELTAMLGNTQPESNLSALVKRGEERIRLNVSTFRKEFVDIYAIFRQLSRNRIIEKHLEKTGRSDFFDSMPDRMASAVSQSRSPREASEAINRIVDEIDVSHTAVIPATAGLSFSSQPKGTLGFVLQRHTINGRTSYFVVDRKPGSVAYGSAIELGDEIVSVNGLPIEQSKRLDLSGHEDRHQLFTIYGDLAEQVEIEFLQSPFDDTQVTQLEVAKDPTTVQSLRASARVINHKKMEIGYVRFWNLMSMGVNQEFSKLTRGEFANSSAIVMDLRGRGGIVPAVLALDRTVKKVDKPVVVIIDSLTRSAKEMLTFLLKKQEHVLVVGTKTSGAVTGATMVKLPSGNSLMVPVASAESLKQFIDGAIIEGVGVAPDEEVDFFVPFSAGNDRILRTALDRATDLAVQRKVSMAKNLSGQ